MVTVNISNVYLEVFVCIVGGEIAIYIEWFSFLKSCMLSKLQYTEKYESMVENMALWSRMAF